VIDRFLGRPYSALHYFTPQHLPPSHPIFVNKICFCLKPTLVLDVNLKRKELEQHLNAIQSIELLQLLVKR